jgi:hypothetical protein
MTLRDAYNVFAILVLVGLLVAGVVLWDYDPWASSTRPPPPSGYEYCTPNGHLNLCPKGQP